MRWLSSMALTGAALVSVVFGAAAVELPPISLNPMVVWEEVGVGESRSGSFEVTNLGERTTTLNVAVFDFLLGETGAFITLMPGSLGKNSLADHITFTPERMTLEAGATRRVSYTISLPPEAHGPRWATLIVTPESTEEVALESDDEGALGFLARLEVSYGFSIFQREPDPPAPAGQVMDMRVRGVLEEDGTRQLLIETTFQNLSEDVARCTVYFEIRDPEGETLARHVVPSERVVLPGARRVFSHAFEGLEIPPGEYLILGVVDFGGDHLTAGQYIANVRE